MRIRRFDSNLFIQLHDFFWEMELMAADATGNMIGGCCAGSPFHASGLLEYTVVWSVYILCFLFKSKITQKSRGSVAKK